MPITNNHFEIFCGTGGVGKTTLATTRALYLQQQGFKTLLITIDPAKRLKQLLGIPSMSTGEAYQVDPKSFSLPKGKGKLDALLMSERAAFQRVLPEYGQAFLENRILGSLLRPYGGMNEIFALLELNYFHQSGKYDVIVLDTPPGDHFIDFLQAAEKIHQFFDSKFIDLFNSLQNYLQGKKSKEKKRGFVKKVLSQGIGKLMHYLGQVTGEQFVEEFVEAISLFYHSKSAFIDALALQNVLKDGKKTNWYLTTSVEHQKIKEAYALQRNSARYFSGKQHLLINQSLLSELNLWQPSDIPLQKLQETMRNKENELIQYAENCFESMMVFPSVTHFPPDEQIKHLVTCWEK